MKALPYFNVNAETTLQMDASKKGLGACLIQNGEVVCYASRALTKTEQNYQNLEQEEWKSSTISYMVRNLHWKHHKKHMVDISPRVQRLIVRSFRYLPFNVVYKKGKDIPVADALS